jgi:hypothetical protein
VKDALLAIYDKNKRNLFLVYELFFVGLLYGERNFGEPGVEFLERVSKVLLMNLEKISDAHKLRLAPGGGDPKNMITNEDLSATVNLI